MGEKLKATNRYICSSNGTIICQNGWEPCHDPEKEKLEPCSMPICDPQCQHGECRAPNFYACEIGWEGTHCDTCVLLPGCDHGTCENALNVIVKMGGTVLTATFLNARIVNMDVSWLPKCVC